MLRRGRGFTARHTAFSGQPGVIPGHPTTTKPQRSAPGHHLPHNSTPLQHAQQPNHGGQWRQPPETRRGAHSGPNHARKQKHTNTHIKPHTIAPTRSDPPHSHAHTPTQRTPHQTTPHTAGHLYAYAPANIEIDLKMEVSDQNVEAAERCSAASNPGPGPEWESGGEAGMVSIIIIIIIISRE